MTAPDRASDRVLAAIALTAALAALLRFSGAPGLPDRAPEDYPRDLVLLRWWCVDALPALALAALLASRRLAATPSVRWGLRAVATLALITLIAPLLATPEATLSDLTARKLPPSFAHPLGTDVDGRDALTVLSLAAPVSVAAAALAATVAVTLGASLGALAGWRGGAVDQTISFVADTLLSLPPLVAQLVLLVVVEPFGAQRLTLVIAVLGATSWMGAARVVRAEVRALRERPFVIASQLAGLSDAEIARVHLLPHLLPVLGALAASTAAGALLAEVGLTWLGLGVTAPHYSFGTMLRGVNPILSPARELLAPAAAIAAWGVALAAIADGLADRTATARN